MGITVLSPVPAVGLSDTVPNAITAVGAAGASTLQSRADHVHPYADTGWLALALINNWVNYDAVTWGVASYRRINGIVFCRGLVKSGTADTPIANLPAGFRPPAAIYHMYPDASDAGYMRIDVRPGGDIDPVGAATAYVSLCSIIFVADG